MVVPRRPLEHVLDLGDVRHVELADESYRDQPGGLVDGDHRRPRRLWRMVRIEHVRPPRHGRTTEAPRRHPSIRACETAVIIGNVWSTRRSAPGRQLRFRRRRAKTSGRRSRSPVSQRGIRIARKVVLRLPRLFEASDSRGSNAPRRRASPKRASRGQRGQLGRSERRSARTSEARSRAERERAARAGACGSRRRARAQPVGRVLAGRARVDQRRDRRPGRRRYRGGARRRRRTPSSIAARGRAPGSTTISTPISHRRSRSRVGRSAYARLRQVRRKTWRSKASGGSRVRTQGLLLFSTLKHPHITRNAGSTLTATLTPPRILTVDDDPIVRADLRVILEDAGFSVVPDARDGDEAVEHAREHAPDLIVLDLGLPGLDGFDAASRILRERDVPIVALTGHSEPEILQRAADAGAGQLRAEALQRGRTARDDPRGARRAPGGDRAGVRPAAAPSPRDGRVDGARERLRARDRPRGAAGRRVLASPRRPSGSRLGSARASDRRALNRSVARPAPP